jgi:hypothetical protein
MLYHPGVYIGHVQLELTVPHNAFVICRWSRLSADVLLSSYNYFSYSSDLYGVLLCAGMCMRDLACFNRIALDEEHAQLRCFGLLSAPTFLQQKITFFAASVCSETSLEYV